MSTRLTRQNVWMVVGGERLRRISATVWVTRAGNGYLPDGREVKRVKDGWEYEAK